MPFRFLGERFANRYAGHPKRLLAAVIKVGAFCHVWITYGYSIEAAEGASMLPTLEVVGERLLISKCYRRGRGINVGDVVAFDGVTTPDQPVIKRVVGLEGDYVLRDTPGTASNTMNQVPEGHCWVVGDNLPFSRDSRHYGPVPLALIRGKVIARVLPFKERKWIENNLESVA